MACPRKKATVSYIKEILSLALRAFDPSHEYSSRGEDEFRFSLLILESRSMGRRVFNKRDNFVPSRPASQYRTACRPGFYPTGASPSTRNTNQLKEQWSLQIPLSYARSPSGVFMKRAFLYASRLFFLKR